MSSLRGLAPSLIFTGVITTASGVLIEFRVEHGGFDGGNASLIGLALTLAGLLTAGAGVGTWAKRASPLRIVLAAVSSGIAAWAVARYGHINFHGWTVVLGLIAFAAAAGAFFLLIAAAARL